jgi:hypothetical protein
VPLVIMTHTTTEGATHAAIWQIDLLACVRCSGMRTRVLSE